MFGKPKKKKQQSQKKATPKPVPTRQEKEIKYMPDGTPCPDFEIPATEGNISLLKEQDEVIKKLTEQIHHAKTARRQIIRTIVSSQEGMPPEADLVFDYFPEPQAVRVYLKTTLQAAQLAAKEKAAIQEATKPTEELEKP